MMHFLNATDVLTNRHYQQQKLNFNRNRLNLSDKSKSVSNLHVNLSIWIDFE